MLSGVIISLKLIREKVQEKLLSVGSVREELGTVERIRPGWSKLYFWNDDYLVSRCVCVLGVCVYVCVCTCVWRVGMPLRIFNPLLQFSKLVSHSLIVWLFVQAVGNLFRDLGEGTSC